MVPGAGPRLPTTCLLVLSTSDWVQTPSWDQSGHQPPRSECPTDGWAQQVCSAQGAVVSC